MLHSSFQMTLYEQQEEVLGRLIEFIHNTQINSLPQIRYHDFAPKFQSHPVGISSETFM